MSDAKERPAPAESEWAGENDAHEELFGGIKRKMAEINAEAEQSRFDGFVGKVFVWIRREWKWILTALLIPLLSFGYRYYLYWMEFPVVPQIITAEEFHLLVTYADEIKAELPYATVDTKVKSGNRTLSTYSMYDTDADGVGDVYVSLLKHGPLKSSGWRSVTDADGNRTIEYFEVPWEPQELEVDSGIFRVHVLDVLLGREDGFGVSAEDICLDDHVGWLHMIVNQPAGNDHAEFRAFIDEMLQIAEAAMAAEAEGGS